MAPSRAARLPARGSNVSVDGTVRWLDARGFHVPQQNGVRNPQACDSSWHVLREIRSYCADADVSGLGPASRRALERWGFYPRVEAHGSAWRILAEEAFVAFGNGLCGLEVPVFGSLIDGRDVRFVGGGRMARTLWTGSGRSCPMIVSPAAWRRGGTSRALAPDRQGLYFLPAGPRSNLRTLEQLSWVLSQLIAAGADDSSSVWLVPVVYRVSPIHVLASRLLPRHSPTRFLARVRAATWAGVPAVFIGAPRSAEDLAIRGDEDPVLATQRLVDLWASAEAEARSAIPRWSPFRS